MAEPEGTADLEEQQDAAGILDADSVEDKEEGHEHEGAQAPPRRRSVSELLDGQDELAEGAKDGLQLVAPPIHVETVDSGQPIYQLDLSSDEPHGDILEPEVPPEAAAAAAQQAAAPVPIDAHTAVKQLVANRDRRIMVAERDGIDAYELASGLDEFVIEVIEAVNRYRD